MKLQKSLSSKQWNDFPAFHSFFSPPVNCQIRPNPDCWTILWGTLLPFFISVRNDCITESADNVPVGRVLSHGLAAPFTIRWAFFCLTVIMSVGSFLHHSAKWTSAAAMSVICAKRSLQQRLLHCISRHCRVSNLSKCHNTVAIIATSIFWHFRLIIFGFHTVLWGLLLSHGDCFHSNYYTVFFLFIPNTL